MPRTARAIVADQCYHLINRGNNRLTRFHDRADFIAFLWLIAEAQDHVALDIFGMCVMPNHVHLIVRPRCDEDIARWAHWLFTTHARRYHGRYKTTGHVWQGRFKAFAIEGDRYFLTALRYVEQNPLRAGLVRQAEKWEWGSLQWRTRTKSPVALSPSPVPLPQAWLEYVNQPQTPAELELLRKSVNRQAPFGSSEWQSRMAEKLNLAQTMAALGRPRASSVTGK